MTKKFILNIFLNLALLLLVMSAVSAYQAGNMLFLGISIAISVVLVYLKVVLLKYVNKEAKAKYQQKLEEAKKGKK